MAVIYFAYFNSMLDIETAIMGIRQWLSHKNVFSAVENSPRSSFQEMNFRM